jgi:hypothetical protein
MSSFQGTSPPSFPPSLSSLSPSRAPPLHIRPPGGAFRKFARAKKERGTQLTREVVRFNLSRARIQDFYDHSDKDLSTSSGQSDTNGAVDKAGMRVFLFWGSVSCLLWLDR